MDVRTQLVALSFLAVVTMLAGASAHAFTITLDDGNSSSRLVVMADGATVPTGDELSPITSDLPLSETLSDPNGNSSSSAAFYISETEFSVGFSHTLGTELHDRAWGMAELYFRSDEDLNYAVESAYSVLNLEQGWAILTTIIEEVHSPTDLTRAYSSFDRLDPNSPESFSLGLRERIPVIETLYANRLYRLRMSAQIGRSEGISAGTATGSGSSRVTFTQAPVPEPGTALLVAFGLAALAHRA